MFTVNKIKGNFILKYLFKRKSRYKEWDTCIHIDWTEINVPFYKSADLYFDKPTLLNLFRFLTSVLTFKKESVMIKWCICCDFDTIRKWHQEPYLFVKYNCHIIFSDVGKDELNHFYYCKWFDKFCLWIWKYKLWTCVHSRTFIRLYHNFTLSHTF